MLPGPQLHAHGDWGATESQMTEILLGCLPNWIREVEKEI